MGRLTQPFEVVRDPALTSTSADLIAGTALQRRVMATIDEVAEFNRSHVGRLPAITDGGPVT